MRINQTLFKKIMRDEARRTLREAFEASGDDLIQRAYAGGDVESARPTDDDRDDDSLPGGVDPSSIDDDSDSVEVDGEEDEPSGEEDELNDEEIDQETEPEDESDEGKVRKSLMESF